MHPVLPFAPLAYWQSPAALVPCEKNAALAGCLLYKCRKDSPRSTPSSGWPLPVGQNRAHTLVSMWSRISPRPCATAMHVLYRHLGSAGLRAELPACHMVIHHRVRLCWVAGALWACATICNRQLHYTPSPLPPCPRLAADRPQCRTGWPPSPGPSRLSALNSAHISIT